MKKIIIALISSIFALTAFGGMTASAETDVVYPEKSEFIKPLVFTSLDDFAVDGEKYTFLQGEKIYTYEDGELNCEDYDEEVYEFLPAETEITIGSYLYYYDDEGKLTVYNKSSKHSDTFDGDFSNLKIYGETVYAVKDNALYRFPDGAEEEISLEYFDYSLTQNITVGQTANALKNYTLAFVTVSAGSYMTEVDLTALDGEYFICGDTVKTETQINALLLCNTGNASVIAVGEASYILNASDVSADTSKYTYTPEFRAATILGNDIYSAPFVVAEPALTDAMNMVVEVITKVECEGVLDFIFYEVKYTAEDGSEKYGYVTSGLLSGIYITADNEDPSEITDPDYSEKSNTKTVLLILAVIILIIAAIAYLAFIGTKGKKKEKTAVTQDKKEK